VETANESKSNRLGNMVKLFNGKIKLKFSKKNVLGYPNLTGLSYGWCKGFYFIGNVTYR